MCATVRSPVGWSSVPAVIEISSSSSACQNRLPPQREQKPRRRSSASYQRSVAASSSVELGLVAGRVARGVAVRPPAAAAVADDDLAELAADLVAHAAALAATPVRHRAQPFPSSAACPSATVKRRS